MQEACLIKNAADTPFPSETLRMIADERGYESIRRLRFEYDAIDLRTAPFDPGTGLRRLSWGAENRRNGMPLASLAVYFGAHEYTQANSDGCICPLLVRDVRKSLLIVRDNDIAIMACGLLKRFHESRRVTAGRLFRGDSSIWLLNYGLELDITNTSSTLILPITVLGGA